MYKMLKLSYVLISMLQSLELNKKLVEINLF